MEIHGEFYHEPHELVPSERTRTKEKKNHGGHGGTRRITEEIRRFAFFHSPSFARIAHSAPAKALEGYEVFIAFIQRKALPASDTFSPKWFHRVFGLVFEVEFHIRPARGASLKDRRGSWLARFHRA